MGTFLFSFFLEGGVCSRYASDLIRLIGVSEEPNNDETLRSFAFTKEKGRIKVNFCVKDFLF